MLLDREAKIAESEIQERVQARHESYQHQPWDLVSSRRRQDSMEAESVTLTNTRRKNILKTGRTNPTNGSRAFLTKNRTRRTSHHISDLQSSLEVTDWFSQSLLCRRCSVASSTSTVMSIVCKMLPNATTNGCWQSDTSPES